MNSNKDRLLNLALGYEDKPPEQPEALSWLRRSRNYNIPVYSGSLFDQPNVLMMEMDTVVEAEFEHENRKAMLQKLASKYKNERQLPIQ